MADSIRLQYNLMTSGRRERANKPLPTRVMAGDLENARLEQSAWVSQFAPIVQKACWQLDWATNQPDAPDALITLKQRRNNAAQDLRVIAKFALKQDPTCDPKQDVRYQTRLRMYRNETRNVAFGSGRANLP